MDCYIREMGTKTHAKLYKDQNGKIHVGERGTQDALNCNCSSQAPADANLLCSGMAYLGVFKVVPDAKRNCKLSAEFSQSDHPAVNVTWYEALGYMDDMTKKTGREFRFLTGDEWEYAAKGGKDFKYATATGELTDCQGNKLARYDKGWETGTTASVGQYDPNPFGIFDMTGNVWEWTSDWWNGEQEYRVLRGASWLNYVPQDLRAAYCGDSLPDDAGSDVGFRVAVAP
jgi:formylglycine-generating enzyme required for sulfatase activity